MVFSSTVFLFLFLPGLLILYYLPVKKSFRRTWRNAILLLFSIGFYTWGEPLFVFLMIASVFLNWFLTLLLERSGQRKKLWLTVSVVWNVLILAIFKYVSFLSENLAKLTGNDKLLIEIALPIGISFFTFQMMSYVFDVYYGYAKAQKNPFYVLLYISLFPQLIAGPIVRYQDVENEIVSRSETFGEFSEGVRRFIYGLSKKVLLSNFLAQIADSVFDYAKSPSVLGAWLGILAYTLQIYFDFSGYSDMAIGLGQMFGFHFKENFNYPYLATSVTDFWRRWHISLSTWFRDYVYIPMGGNRVKKSRWILNLFTVWLLTGIWHGANWTFLLWGLLYFVLLLIEKLTGFAEKIGFASRIYTLLAVMLAWVFFRANSISDGIRYVGYLFGVGTSGILDPAFTGLVKGSYVILLVSLLAATPLVAKFFRFLNRKNMDWVEAIWLCVLSLLCVLEVVCSTYNPFIYFNF